MTIFTTLRNRLSTPKASAGDSQGEISGSDYDRLDARQVVDGLHLRSQVDLEAVESYERSHQNRVAVLDKLRYMRGSEPLPGYDALEMEEVLAVVKDADLPTIKKIRGYERKFANRAAVLELVLEVQHERIAAQPAAVVPAYQSLGGASA